MAIPVQKVTINGKQYPFHLGIGAMRIVAMKTGQGNYKLTELDKLMEESSMESLGVIVWAGLKSGAAKQEEDFDMSIEDVEEILIEDPPAMDNLLNKTEEAAEEIEDAEEGNQEKGNDES